MRKMESKAQVGQIFIYLAAVIVAGAIILIGFTSIDGILTQGCEVQQQKFVSDVTSFLDRHTRLGSSSVFSKSAPCEFDTICFAPGSGADTVDDGDVQDLPAVVQAAALSDDEPNVILGEAGIYEGVHTYEGIRLEDGVYGKCFNVSQGNLAFSVIGQGRGRVQIR